MEDAPDDIVSKKMCLMVEVEAVLCHAEPLVTKETSASYKLYMTLKTEG